MSKLLILLLLGFSLVVHSSQDWELIKDSEDIRVYSTQKHGHELKHFKGQTLISKNIDTLLTALQDTEACPDWVYNCLSNKMVEMLDVRTRIYHTTIDTPLWFKDRDFYLQSHVIYQPKLKLLTIRLESKPEYAQESDNKKRLTDVEMVWTLERVSADVTLVTYQVYIDPKLPFKSINHSMIKRSVFKTLQGLTEIVTKAKYGKTKYSQAELEMLTDEK